MTRLDQILTQCIEDVQSGRKSVAECLEAHPELRDQLEPALRMVERLTTARQLSAPEGFKQVAQIRIQNRIAQRLHQTQSRPSYSQRLSGSWRRWSGWRRIGQATDIVQKPGFMSQRSMVWLGLVVYLIVTSLLTSGVVYASSKALPGDVLYPAKLIVERFQIVLSGSDNQDTELYLNFATERLDEARQLIERNRVADIGQPLDEYGREVTIALNILSQNEKITDQRLQDVANLVYQKLDQHEEQLEGIQNLVHGVDWEKVQTALQASRQGREMIRQILQQHPWQIDTPGSILRTHVPVNESKLGSDTPTVTNQETTLPTQPELGTIIPTDDWTPRDGIKITETGKPTARWLNPSGTVEWTPLNQWTTLPTHRTTRTPNMPRTRPLRLYSTPSPPNGPVIPTPQP